MEIRDQLYVATLFVTLCSSCVAQNGMQKPKCKYDFNTGHSLVCLEYFLAFLGYDLFKLTTC